MEDKILSFFEAIYSKYFKLLLYYSYRITWRGDESTDIVEESFIKLWNLRIIHHHFSNPDKEKVVYAWLSTTVHRASTNYLVKTNSRKTKHIDILNEYYGYSVPPHDQLMIQLDIDAAARQLVHSAIKRLPKECRLIFTNLYIHGFTAKETSELMGVSISTIKTQKARGLEILSSIITIRGNLKPAPKSRKKQTAVSEKRILRDKILSMSENCKPSVIAKKLQMDANRVRAILHYWKNHHLARTPLIS